jgi:hypothetical protein
LLLLSLSVFLLFFGGWAFIFPFIDEHVIILVTLILFFILA